MIFKIFDNSGKTFDRYTLLTEPWYFGKSCNAYSFSKNAKKPDGFNQYVGDVYEGAKIGKEIKFEELPEEVQSAVLKRIEE